MRYTILFASLSAFTVLVSADFFLSNSTICMGAFPMQNCWHGPDVFSGVSNTTDFTCPKLMHALDNVYVWNGTAGPQGTDLHAKKPCGVEYEMTFVKDGFKYTALDKAGQQVADCQEDQSLARHCPQWIGAMFFETQYRCTSDSITCT